MTIALLAEHWQVSQCKIHRMITEGLPVLQFDRAVRIHPKVAAKLGSRLWCRGRKQTPMETEPVPDPKRTPGAGATETQRRPSPRRAAVSADPAVAGEVYINREQLRSLVPASDMSVWRWQRNPAIAFPRSVKLGENGRNFWWLPAIRAWLQRREERAEPRNPPDGDGQTEQIV
jgi:predicted DNA-binding transcriptional regulator AlpA